MSDEVVADNRNTLALFDEYRVRRAVAGPVGDVQAVVGELERLAVAQGSADVNRGGESSAACGLGVGCGDQRRGDAVKRHHAGAKRLLGKHRCRSVACELDEWSERGDF